MPDPEILSAKDINGLISHLIGTDTSLNAVLMDEEVFLITTEESEEQEVLLTQEDRTREELTKLLYEYAVNFGYTSDDFEDWRSQ